MTKLIVDELTVPRVTYTNLKNKIFRMTASAVFQKEQDKEIICYPGSVQINKVCIDNISPENIIYNDDKVVIEMCSLILQYQTDVIAIYDKEE